MFLFSSWTTLTFTGKISFEISYIESLVLFGQSMVFEGGHLEGQAKGLREVCLERFGEDSIIGKNKTLYRFKKVKINSPCSTTEIGWTCKNILEA